MARLQKRSKVCCTKRISALEHSRHAALNSLPAKRSQDSYAHAMDEFILWYCSEPRLAFGRTVGITASIFPGTK